MKRFKVGLSVLLVMVCSMVVTVPTGCSRSTLAPGGVYQGDNFLYQAEKTITTAYKSFESFVKWEHQYRAVLPVEVSRAADTVRSNAKRWIDSASTLRDAYAANPTSENRDKLKLSLDLIDAALSEATKYLLENKAKAPSVS